MHSKLPPEHVMDLATRAAIDVLRFKDRARGLKHFDDLSPALQEMWRKDAEAVVKAVEFVLRNHRLPLRLVS